MGKLYFRMGCYVLLTWLRAAELYSALQVGLQPDLACVPEATQAEYWVAGSRNAEDLSQDPCIQMAQDKVISMQAAASS